MAGTCRKDSTSQLPLLVRNPEFRECETNFETISEIKEELKSGNYLTVSNLKNGTEIFCAKDRFYFSTKIINLKEVDLQVSSTQRQVLTKSRFDGFWNRLKKCDVQHLNGTFVPSHGPKRNWTYTGQVIPNTTTAHGVGFYSDEAFAYAGKWVDDKPHGIGKFTSVEKNEVFVGEFEYGQAKRGLGWLTAKDKKDLKMKTKRAYCIYGRCSW
eukprot:641053_1